MTTPHPTARDRFLGCLLGGAVGDALGAPVEFLSRRQMQERHGPAGVRGYTPAYGRLGAITDDTQMSLFTAEGLLRAWVRGRFRGVTSWSGVTAHAYLRWLQTQGEAPRANLAFGGDAPGWLIGQRALHARRAPGNTCLAALREMPALGAPARNDSKGCGGVMRMAPLGLFAWRLGHGFDLQACFRLGVELAALTHGHPSGQLPAGVLAATVHGLLDEKPLRAALDAALEPLRAAQAHGETLRAIEAALRLADTGADPASAIARLGQGWVAEEALAIALYCALVAKDFTHGLQLAVEHDGDSDSTAAIAGNLLGALQGVGAIPAPLLETLELREVITELAGDLYDFAGWNIGEYSADAEANERVWRKYPGF